MDVRATKVALFGEVGADRYDDALRAAHAFAQASNCPPGDDVFKWLAASNDKLIEAELSARPTQEGA